MSKEGRAYCQLPELSNSVGPPASGSKGRQRKAALGLGRVLLGEAGGWRQGVVAEQARRAVGDDLGAVVCGFLGEIGPWFHRKHRRDAKRGVFVGVLG